MVVMVMIVIMLAPTMFEFFNLLMCSVYELQQPGRTCKTTNHLHCHVSEMPVINIDELNRHGHTNATAIHRDLVYRC